MRLGVVDEDGLDSRGTELDAERGLARADLLRDRGNLIGSFCITAMVVDSLPCPAGPYRPLHCCCRER